ncbi:DUF1983 domain-containing protein [Vibrio metschnikovii]|nr:DUF1983 domain-containing protein [Vibrio metschnikovii]
MKNKTPFRAGRTLEALYENVEILTGQRGNGHHKAVTEKDVAAIKGAVNKIAVGSKPGSGGEIVEVPHAPQNVQAFGGFSAILVQWDNPTFKGYAYAEVWRATKNNLSQAVQIATTPANVFSDVVNTGSRFYYWVRFINKSNVAGPYQDVNGVIAQTSPDIADIIDELAEQLRGSEVFKLVQADIDTKATQDQLENARADLEQANISLRSSIEQTQQEISIARSELEQADATLLKAINATSSALQEAKEDLSKANVDLDEALNNAKSAIDDELARIEVEYKSADASAYANIKMLEKVLSDTSKVLAMQVSQLNAAYSTQNAAQAAETSAQITEAKRVLAESDRALAEIVSGLEVAMKTGDIEINAKLTTLEQTVASEKEALSQRITDLDAAYKAESVEINAGLSSLEKTVSDNNQAMSQRIDTLDSSYKDADNETNASLTALSQAVSDANKAISQRIDSVESGYQSADQQTNAKVTSLEQSLTSSTEAMAKRADNIETEFKAADAELAGSISSLEQVVSDETQSLAQQISKVETDYQAGSASNSSKIESLDKTLADASKVIAMQIQQLNAAYKAVSDGETAESEAKFTEVRKTISDAEKALVEIIQQLESNFGDSQNETNAKVTSLEQSLASSTEAIAKRVDTVEAQAGAANQKGDEAKAAAQTNSQAIAAINEDGTSAFKAMWAAKAQAGDVRAGIGIVAKSDGTSQVAVSASQFFVFDPNNPNETITPTFAIDKGIVVIPKALIENATIQILQAQEITADYVRAGIEMSSPKINAGEIRGGDAGFGTGGPYNGYRTFIHSNGLIQTDNLQANGGRLRNLVIDEDCEIKGTLTVGQIRGDIYTVINVVRNTLFRVTINRQNSGQYHFLGSFSIESESITRTLQIPPISHGGAPPSCSTVVVVRWLNNLGVQQQRLLLVNTASNQGRYLYLDIPSEPSGREIEFNLYLSGAIGGNVVDYTTTFSAQTVQVTLYKSRNVNLD